MGNLDFLIENKDGSFVMPAMEDGKEYVFLDGKYVVVDVVSETATPPEETLDPESIEYKIKYFGLALEQINGITEDKNLSPDAKAQMSLSPCIDALYKAGDIISTLIDKMEASCCTLDETIVKVAKNEADIVILKAK